MNIVRENLIEGVADKFLQNKGIAPEEFEEFYRKYNSSILSDKVFFRDGDWALVKNPSSLIYFGESVRGVIVENGDFYLELFSEVIHNDILKILFAKKIIKGNFRRNWTRKLPQESGFLTVQRYRSSNYMAIGESNNILYDDYYYDENIKYYNEFLDKARKKCPGINFASKLVGTKYLKQLSAFNIMDESYEI